MKPNYKLIIAIALPVIVGAVSGFFTQSSVNGWFVTLRKPSYNPPGWLFAPVWTTLYILMGIAFYMVWKSNTQVTIKRKAVSFYFIQLGLNFLWSILFFGARQPGWAFIDIIAMLIAIALTIFWFKKISTTAAWLMVPYICWVSFATVLNYAIWKLN